MVMYGDVWWRSVCLIIYILWIINDVLIFVNSKNGLNNFLRNSRGAEIRILYGRKSPGGL